MYAEPMGLTVHRTPFGVKQTEPPAGEPLAEVRRRTDLAIHGFVQDARAGKQTALLVHVPPGVGKSQSLVSALGTNPRAARVMVGTLALAREQAAALNAHVLEGFSSANCQRFEVVQAL
jgi:hypothetical protein